jgi:hypothetical protein
MEEGLQYTPFLPCTDFYHQKRLNSDEISIPFIILISR